MNQHGPEQLIIPRTLHEQALQMAQWFPIVSITGPRQSGKSTLVHNAFPDYQYVNLEDRQTRTEALEDPVGFIRNRPAHLIIDEAQYAPDLFSMIQVVSDERNEPGQYVLSGSQNFLLLKQIKQSLAGRVGLLKLLPLSYQETRHAAHAPTSDEFMLTGGFPRIYASHIPRDMFFRNYIDTYVERDASDYLDVRNITGFRKFLELCALNAGNLINYTHLSNDTDVAVATVKSWLSILESSYVTFQLTPYHANARKRLTKTPKLYFHDTGLLCHLLGLGTLQDLLESEYLGMVFENLIVSETLKRRLNEGKEPRLNFYRDDSKIEVDLLDLTDRHHETMAEIKSGQTYHDRYARNLLTIGKQIDIPDEQLYVVSRVANSYRHGRVNVSNAADWLMR